MYTTYKYRSSGRMSFIFCTFYETRSEQSYSQQLATYNLRHSMLPLDGRCTFVFTQAEGSIGTLVFFCPEWKPIYCVKFPTSTFPPASSPLPHTHTQIPTSVSQSFHKKAVIYQFCVVRIYIFSLDLRTHYSILISAMFHWVFMPLWFIILLNKILYWSE